MLNTYVEALRVAFLAIDDPHASGSRERRLEIWRQRRDTYLTADGGICAMTVVVADNDSLEHPTGLAHAHFEWDGPPRESPLPTLLCRAKTGTTNLLVRQALNEWAGMPGVTRCATCLDFLVP